MVKLWAEILSAVLIGAILFLCSACAVPPQTGNPSNGKQTLTDAAGRTVILNGDAQRVVSCYYITTSAMLSLGVGDRLVGIEKKAESRPIYAMANEELLSLPQIGSLKEINAEAIAALNPDLVLLPMKLSDTVDTFSELGIQTLVVDPENMEGLREMLGLIGLACGVSERADALCAYYDEKLLQISQKLADVPYGLENPTVCILGNSSYLTVAAAGMFQNDMISYVGGINAAAPFADGDYWTEVSYETLYTMNPRTIILPSNASYTMEEFLNDEELWKLGAICSADVYQMPGLFEAWDSPLPSSILGILWLYRELYFSDINDLREEIKTFYETFYGFTPDEKLLNEIY